MQNGRIAKENVKLRATAMDSIWRSVFGAPCQIVQGYIKKLIIEVPWYDILKKPVEIKLDEIHIIMKSSDSYDREFMRQCVLADKKKAIQKLLDQLKKDVNEHEAVKKDSYLSGVLKLIWENLRINIKNLHIRFEDSKLSRMDQAFNFGLIAESISYSMTNNRFKRAFLSLDDKHQEQKSFSLLSFFGFAMYWNSNAQDNWTCSQRFINFNATDIIKFSRAHMSNLMSKHFQDKQEADYAGNLNSVFLIQPCEFHIKFRTNLAPADSPKIPISTTVWENQDINITIDEEVYKDFQYLSKLFAWHNNSIKKKFLKFRPPYNLQVIGNARAYWRYAINAVIYQRRKQLQKGSKQLQIKRHQEMIMLTEIYKMESYNSFCRENKYEARLLADKTCGTFDSELQMQ